MPEKPILVVTRRLPAAVEARIKLHYEARFNTSDRLYTRDELLAESKRADALLITPQDRMDASLLSRLPESVQMVATLSVGFDHIDVKAAEARGIAVTNTPGVLTDATADIAMLLLLGASRRATEGQALVRGDTWNDPRPTDLLGWQLTGKILGVYGMGRIGQAVAERARAFGMKIHYCKLHRLTPEVEKDAVFHADASELLAVSSFLTLHAPATAETDRFLNAKTIELLPKGAIVVNAARGSLVDDEALIAALRSGHIAAAGLDVYEGEPHIHPGYRTLPNTFLLPHLGSATIETRTKMGMIALDNLDAHFAGRPLLTPVL
ncbi:MAG TPA: D-glycerate dehydrogenase [Candidatus Sulfotelmatobacter sp.]|nr:D-glycerate dehydrogenase [Candidatus Sulfotelmatobacter sp.]